MEDLIRRKDIKNLLCETCVKVWGSCFIPESQCKSMIAIDNIPAVKLEIVTKTEIKRGEDATH